MDWNDRVIDDWERKWLDPDYDMARGRYRDLDDDEDEEYEEEDEIDKALNFIFGLE